VKLGKFQNFVPYCRITPKLFKNVEPFLKNCNSQIAIHAALWKRSEKHTHYGCKVTNIFVLLFAHLLHVPVKASFGRNAIRQKTRLYELK
jgi:hypothetical protein